MISETARPETQAGGRQRTWARGAARLAGLLAFLGVLGLLGLVLVTAAVPRLWGYQTYVIYGSSMEATFILGSSSDTWDRTWSDTEFTNDNFRVRITNVAATKVRDFSLDWVPVQVSYTPP